MAAPLELRIAENIELSDSGCWLWTLRKDRTGYGRISISGVGKHVHRVAYEVFVGPIPDELQIDHLCRVRHCANPAHMECVPQQVNIRRGMAGVHNANKTHCPQGHPYAGQNLIITSSGGRRCRVCQYDHARKGNKKYRARKRAEKMES